MKDFYVTLLSDSSLDIFPNNKQNSFTVKLDYPIQIDKENWEVAMVEMITPSEVLNITDENNLFFLRIFHKQILTELENRTKVRELDCTTDNFCIEYELRLTKGNYATPQHLAEEIEATIHNEVGKALEKNNCTIRVNYVKSSNRIRVNISKRNMVSIVFSHPLAEKLGVNPRFIAQPIRDEKEAFTYSPDLNTKLNQLYVYSDVASYTFVGDVTAPILRVVPFSRHSTLNFHQEFLNLHYVPVAKSFIDQIHISIKGETGDNIPFITGKTLIKLHFRQREN